MDMKAFAIMAGSLLSVVVLSWMWMCFYLLDASDDDE